MKLRTGFVSNSSSSSFCITAKPDEKGRVLVQIDLAKLGGKVCKSETQLRNEFNDRYDYDPDDPSCSTEYPDTKRLYDHCLEEIKKDKAVVVGSIDNMMVGILEYVSGGSQVLEQDGYISV